MSRVRSKNTEPEMQVRRLVHRMGYRYRLHQVDLPGKPDLVFRKHKSVIFVNGCFWHRHSDSSCKLARMPKSNLDYWKPKLEANKLRDKMNIKKLRLQGWKILVIWECQIKNIKIIDKQIRKFFG